MYPDPVAASMRHHCAQLAVGVAMLSEAVVRVPLSSAKVGLCGTIWPARAVMVPGWRAKHGEGGKLRKFLRLTKPDQFLTPIVPEP